MRDPDHRPVKLEEMEIILSQMEQAEQTGLFDGMFKAPARAAPEEQGPTRENLLASIGPEMKLYKSFFMKVYGYCITRPGFKYEALEKLKAAGCGKAYEYYLRFVTEYKEQHRKELKEAAKWLLNQRKDDVKVKNIGNGEVETWQNLQKMSDKQLLSLLQMLEEDGQL